VLKAAPKKAAFLLRTYHPLYPRFCSWACAERKNQIKTGVCADFLDEIIVKIDKRPLCHPFGAAARRAGEVGRSKNQGIVHVCRNFARSNSWAIAAQLQNLAYKCKPRANKKAAMKHIHNCLIVSGPTWVRTRDHLIMRPLKAGFMWCHVKR
jgi:hypothetical protein